MKHKHAAEKIASGNDLNAHEAQALVENIIAGELTPAQTAFILGALHAKGESSGEILGTARAMRRHARFIDCGGKSATDIVGTGGDGKNTFNISTTSAFVAASAGVIIAKHGNRAASGLCGSADVLAQLGLNLDCPPVQMERAIQEIGIGFLFAAKMHPCMASVAPLRKELGIRTLFNLAGPLCNPAGAGTHVLGVFAPELTEIYAHALRELGCKRALVVHGMDGLDEISASTESRVCELRDGQIKTYPLHPEFFVGQRFPETDVQGGDARENARILKAILSGEISGGARAAVLLNAGAAIFASGLADDLRGGIQLADESLRSGAPLEKLNALIAYSHQ